MGTGASGAGAPTAEAEGAGVTGEAACGGGVFVARMEARAGGGGIRLPDAGVGVGWVDFPDRQLVRRMVEPGVTGAYTWAMGRRFCSSGSHESYGAGSTSNISRLVAVDTVAIGTCFLLVT